MKKPKKILFIFGTRPEAIKMAPLIRETQKDSFFSTTVCVTAQHREMLDQVLDFFGIKPDFDLDLMKDSQSLEELTARIIVGVRDILLESKPDLVFVQGDTATVMAAALASFYQRVEIAHLEAGLRTGNKQSPFPEEANRVITGHIANYHFAPTEKAVCNLAQENIRNHVYNVGNTVIDALLTGLNLIEGKDWKDDSYFQFLDKNSKILLVTGHRRESFGEPFENICRAILRTAEENPDVQVVYPVHLNPNVKNVVHSKLGGIKNIHLIEPLSYPRMIEIMSKSYIVLTDSGGIQEEAPSLGKPVLVMREHTERQEGVSAGTARLVGTNEEKIYQAVRELLKNPNAYSSMANAVNPYGDGSTSRKIINILKTKIYKTSD